METGTFGASPSYSNSFNAKKFNSEFEEEKRIVKENAKKNYDDRMNQLNYIDREKKLTDYSIYEILIGIKDSWFGILDDLIQPSIDPNILFKYNRLYFIGITFILIGLIMYLYFYFVSEDSKK